jgi:hypothetical protein
MTKETRVSVNTMRDPDRRLDLPKGWTGVRWTDTDWTECRGHIEDQSWAVTVTRSDEPVGTILFGEVECDACREGKDA